jgi:plastocyanin
VNENANRCVSLHMRRKMLITGALVAAIGVGTTTAATARPAATHKLAAAKSGLRFNVSTIHAKAGKVTLRMSNPSRLPHAVGIKGHGKGKTVKKGGTSTVTARLKKGTYTFYCPVPGHAAAGMKGKLVVS